MINAMSEPTHPILASGIPVHCAHRELVDVTTLVPNPRNPNRHPDKQIALLAKVIRHTGWRAPITISNRSGFVVTGHGRLEAAKLLQVELVPVDRQDFATEADEYAHLVADNRLAELAEADDAALKTLLDELDTGGLDLELAGFDADGLAGLVADKAEDVPQDTGINYAPQFGVIVICKAEDEQEKAYNALLALGYECKVVVT